MMDHQTVHEFVRDLRQCVLMAEDPVQPVAGQDEEELQKQALSVAAAHILLVANEEMIAILGALYPAENAEQLRVRRTALVKAVKIAVTVTEQEQ